EALMMLQGKGAILRAARKVSDILDQSGAIIGGVAVVLHGHVRTTNDVDVYVNTPNDATGQLKSAGLKFVAPRREFLCDGVPVHLVTSQEATPPPREFVRIEGIRTISLPDLINLKLQSGTRNITRAQDLADVIGLIRHHKL